METVLVQITNSKAYKLLEDLEDLHIIKLLKTDSQPKQKLSENMAASYHPMLLLNFKNMSLKAERNGKNI